MDFETIALTASVFSMGVLTTLVGTAICYIMRFRSQDSWEDISETEDISDQKESEDLVQTFEKNRTNTYRMFLSGVSDMVTGKGNFSESEWSEWSETEQSERSTSEQCANVSQESSCWEDVFNNETEQTINAIASENDVEKAAESLFAVSTKLRNLLSDSNLSDSQKEQLISILDTASSVVSRTVENGDILLEH